MKKLSMFVIGVCLYGLYGCSGDLRSEFVNACIADGGKDMTEAQTKEICNCAGDGIFSSNEVSDKAKEKLSRGEKGGTDKEQMVVFGFYMECLGKVNN